MNKRFQIIALFSLGLIIGVFAAYYSMDNRTVQASGGTDRSGEYIITSGFLDNATGATYFLDCSTGVLTAAVPSSNSRKAGIWGYFKANVTQDLRKYIQAAKVGEFGQPLVMPTQPNYVMTTAPFYIKGKVGAYSWPSEAVSVVETNTGILMIYFIKYNFTKYQQDVAEAGELFGYTAKQINPVLKRE